MTTMEPPNTIGPTIATLFCSYDFPKARVNTDISSPPAIAAIIPPRDDILLPVFAVRNSNKGAEIDIIFTIRFTKLIFACRLANAPAKIAAEYVASARNI